MNNSDAIKFLAFGAVTFYLGMEIGKKQKKKSAYKPDYASFKKSEYPSVKEVAQAMVSEAVSTGISMILLGRRKKDEPSNPRVSYSAYYGTDSRGGPYKVKDYVVGSTIEEANEILDIVRKRIDEEGELTVSDYYELIGEPCDFSDSNHFWKSIDGAILERTPAGYVINFPKPEKMTRRY